jgi:hypothetical protein
MTSPPRGKIRTVAELYPPIEPYETGMLDAGDGNLVYREVCGNPAGTPELVVHGVAERRRPAARRRRPAEPPMTRRRI